MRPGSRNLTIPHMEAPTLGRGVRKKDHSSWKGRIRIPTLRKEKSCTAVVVAEGPTGQTLQCSKLVGQSVWSFKLVNEITSRLGKVKPIYPDDGGNPQQYGSDVNTWGVVLRQQGRVVNPGVS